MSGPSHPLDSCTKEVLELPYRYDKIKDNRDVIITKYERDVDTLAALGFPAISGPAGGDIWPAEITRLFIGKAVRIFYPAGQDDGARALAIKLAVITPHVYILRVPLNDHDFDITDYFGQFESGDAKRDAFYSILHKEEKFIDYPRENSASAHSAPDMPEINNPFLNRYISHLATVTDAPPLFVLFSGIALLSGILNKFYFMYPRRTNLNLYILLLAPSTYFRKSTITDIVSDYIRDVNPNLLLPDTFTPEALYEIFKNYPRGLLIWRELIQVKEFQLGAEYNKGLPSFLVDLYDYKPKHKRWTKGDGEIVVDNPILSILAAGIASWFVESLKRNDFQGGIWTRFLFIPAPEQEREFSLPREFFLDPSIKKNLSDLDAREGAEMDLGPILPLMKEWGRGHMQQVLKMEDNLQAAFQRLEVMLLKLACLFQLASDGSTVVTETAFHDAVNIIEYVKARLPVFFRDEVTFTQFEKYQAQVRKLLGKRGIMNRREIIQNTRLKAKVLDDVLEQLLYEDIIEESTTLPTAKGGRTGKSYRLKGKA